MVGCGDDNPSSPEPEPTCRIVQFEGSFFGDDISTIEYNSDGNISAITNNDSGKTTTYEYSGNTIIANDGTNTITTTLENDLIMNIRIEDNSDPDMWQNFASEYNGQELTRQVFTNSDGNEREILYEWENGNAVTRTIPGLTSNPIEYHLDQPVQDADFYRFLEIRRYGTPLLHNTNLHKSSFGQMTDYEFDEDGKITSIVITNESSGDTSTIAFTHACE